MLTRSLSMLSVLLILTFAGPAAPATYHVSCEDPGASDDNPGSEDQPFSTISAAVKSLEPGDRVIIHAGVYREQVEFEASGEDWTAPVVIMSAPGEEVSIKGSDIVTGWEKHAGNIWKKTGWTVNSQMVFVDGEHMQRIGGEMVEYLTAGTRWRGKVGDGIDDMMAGSFFMDTAAETIYLWLKDDGDPNDATVEVAVRPFMLVANGDYLVIKGLNLSQSSTGNYVNWPAVRIAGDHITFQDNNVTWCDFIGMGFRGSYIDVINSSFNYCGNSGIGGNSYGGCRFLGNETSYNNWGRWSTGWHAGGMKLIPIERNVIIDRHKAIGNLADGIWIDSYDSGNVTISNCLSAYNEGAGIHFEIAQRGMIINNILHHNHHRGIYLSSSRDTLVAHNVCYANGMSGIVSQGVNRKGPVERFGPGGIVPARNNWIIGNIMMDNMNPELKPEGWSYRPELIMPNPENNPALFGGCVSDANVYWRSDGRAIPFWFNWGEKSWATLEAWQQETGNDMNSIIADPMFVDAENGDFHLKPGSPAAGVVPVRGEVGTDVDGKDRPTKTLRSAGAYILEGAPEKPAPTVPRQPAPQPAPTATGKLPVPPAQSLHLKEFPLPAERAASLADAPELAALGRALGGIELTANGVRVVFPDQPSGVMLTGDTRTVELPLDISARALYFFIAATGGEDGRTVPSVECKVVRGDGVTQTIALDARSVGLSFGPWTGTLDQATLPVFASTSLGWQAALDDGTQARLWLVTYVNDNEWLPVQKLVWTLGEGEGSVVLLKMVAGVAK